MKEVLQQAIDFAEYCLEELDLSYMASNQAKRLIEKSKEALAKQEHGEPVAWADHGVVNWIADKQFKHAALLYEHPQQRTWVGLTEPERVEIAGGGLTRDERMIAKAIEAKLKEKNNGT